MRVSRLFVLLALVAFASMAIAPAVASAAPAPALLTNEYGQSFLGATTAAGCVTCHGTTYNKTSHGQFATAGPDPVAGSGMWPAGLPGRGDTVQASDIAFTLGAGTGMREYLKFGAGTPANGPFGVASLEWNPDEASIWEIPVTGIAFSDYSCNQCHQLGATKKGVTPPIPGAVAGTANAWAKYSGDSTATLASWIPGSSIQCERCHGTGVAADVDNGGHWNTGVKIVGYDTPAMNPNAKAASQDILDSRVCGQCHGSYKSGGNIAGYTPDRLIRDFVPNEYKLTDVPTEASFTANPSAYKFFPSGQNSGNKHVYYTEWAISGHSWRGALTTSSPNATPYQQTGAGHFSSAGSVLCNRCHTGEGYLKRKGASIMANWTESTTSAGKLGTECASCHISHGATTGPDDAVGMAVRAPEGTNKSICEDCHNWQAEVMGTPVVPVSTGRGPSHPTREIYHGKGMFEIPNGIDFMPGAKCEQCHMPATRSDYPTKTQLPRYADRSWKRYSHRMFIMEPGNAENWSLPAWGDSCSPCHPGETQAQLQTNIEKWQTDAAAIDATLLSEITLAKARSEAARAGAYLVSVAFTNDKSYQNEGSAGAHNPPYIQAGLSKGIQLAKSVGGSFAVVSAPSGPVAPSTLNAVAGKIVNGDGSGAAGGTLTLLVGGTPVGTSVSDANGNFAFSVAPAATTTYVVRWDRSSNATTHLLSDAKTITVATAKTPTTITIATSRTSAFIGQTFVLSGLVTPSPDMVGRNMHCDVKKPGKTYWTYSSARTIYSNAGVASWWYRYTLVSGMARGTYQFKGVYDGDATYAASQSSIISVLVR
jgi:cytochrome c553